MGNKAGLSTQPCGVPVLRTIVVEVCFLLRTCCGLLVRKSMIHEQSAASRPGLSSCILVCEE